MEVKGNGEGATGWLYADATLSAMARVSTPINPVAPNLASQMRMSRPWLKDTPRRHFVEGLSYQSARKGGRTADDQFDSGTGLCHQSPTPFSPSA